MQPVHLMPLVRKRLEGELRRLVQTINPPQLAVVGSFHGLNVGDNTLGGSVQQVAAELQITAGLRGYNELDRWPRCALTICGGGATGTHENLALLVQRGKRSTDTTTLVGMDFSGDIEQFPVEILTFLKKVKFLSCRSKRQAHHLSAILESSNATYAPDNAFAFPFRDGIDGRDDVPIRNLIGFNAGAFFMTRTRGNRYIPNTPSSLAASYQKTKSDIAKYIEQLGPKYIDLLTQALEIYRKRGYSLVHVPFTHEDDILARSIFSQLPVDFYSYNRDPHVTFARVAECSLFISTRYHALIYALRSGVPCVPFLYALKCKDLLEDIGEVSKGIDRMQLVHDFDAALAKLIEPAAPIRLSRNRLMCLTNESKQAISRAINALFS